MNTTQNNQSPDNEIVLEGTIDRIVFYNEENNFTIARFIREGDDDPITVVGSFANASAGEMFRVFGQWVMDKRFGEQFKVSHLEPILPKSKKGIEKFLGSGMIKGIGDAYAKRLVKEFGEDTLDVLDNDIEQIRKVAGIGAKRLELIKTTWKENKAVREILINLHDYDISTAYAVKIQKTYGDESVKIVQENPYQLALDIKGIGFKKADEIAGNLGIEKNSSMRAAAGILHVLNDLVSSEGHCFYPYDDLIKTTSELLDIDQANVKIALQKLVNDKKLVIEELPEGEKAVFPKALHVAETNVVLLLMRLTATGKMFPSMTIDKEIEEFESSHKFKLAERQKTAITESLHGGMMVITGGPGTGKTTIVRGLISILEKKGLNIILTAPTGRAAKRLEETTLKKAKTIHRLLKWEPGLHKFKMDSTNPIKADLIIIDESSMIDIVLAYYLLRAIQPTTSVIFVGDVDQLPSVGAGNFLKDIINSNKIPVVELNEIFRQSKRSLIVYNAHRINKGEFPLLPKTEENKTTDFYFIEREDPQAILETVKTLMKERIPEKFKFDPLNDIQVITPMHKGIIGASNLNNELQQLLNPSENFIMRGAVKFKVGDKVMQTKNNYDKDVYNGDIGFIASIDRIDHLVRVNYDYRTVDYDYSDLDEISLAYATTVHKSQGSEFKAVIIPIHTQHYMLLQRNLVYTAITRGKKLVVVVGTKKALMLAIKNDKNSKRYSSLYQRLVYGKILFNFMWSTVSMLQNSF